MEIRETCELENNVHKVNILSQFNPLTSDSQQPTIVSFLTFLVIGWSLQR